MGSTAAISLVIADDHPVVLQGLTELFSSTEGFRVVTTATRGDDALAALRAHRPDVAVLDIRMPGACGLDVARTVIAEALPTKIVLLTAEIEDDQALQAVRIGVHGVILKQMATRLLLECVRKVHAGGRWVEQESLRRAVERLLQEDSLNKPSPTVLTVTESRVVELLAGGARNKEIAEALHVSESTIKSHLHNVYTKLDVSTRQQLVQWYGDRGRARFVG